MGLVLFDLHLEHEFHLSRWWPGQEECTSPAAACLRKIWCLWRANLIILNNTSTQWQPNYHRRSCSELRNQGKEYPCPTRREGRPRLHVPGNSDKGLRHPNVIKESTFLGAGIFLLNAR